MSEHTPGPWMFIKDEMGCKRIGPSRKWRRRGIAEVCATVGLFDEVQDLANARLIAAAPDQMQALKGAPPEPGGNVSVGEFLRQYREWYNGPRQAAIAKAEGES